jgi:hypothetical protein
MPDQLEPEAIPRWRNWSRSLAQVILLVILLLSMPFRSGCFSFGDPVLFGAVCLTLLSMGVQAREWGLVVFVVGVVGFDIYILDQPRGGQNESAAVANLRTINTAEVTYLSSSGGSYGAIEDLIAARLLDDTFTGTKAGYNYTITLDETASGYTAEAVPASAQTGRFGYYSVPDAVVRYSMEASLAPGGQS